MNNKYKPIIALTLIAIVGYLLWTFSWQTWDEKQLWQYYTNTTYQNYLIIGEIIQASVILVATGLSMIRQKPQPTPQQPVNKPETTEIKQLRKEIAKIQRTMQDLVIIQKLNPDTPKGGKTKREP